MLTAIWERVLQRSPIGEQDNFFELGGDGRKAELLCGEMARVFGREMTPVTILQTATIAGLAAVLDHSSQPRIPPLVQLKAGTKEPPIFITHGIGGSILDFFQLANHVHTRHAIYGMQAKGIDGADDPLDRIELMAQYFLDAVKELQPHGPYTLIGHSLGGLVTLEMARRLSAAGERVALLAMLESYPARRYLPFRELLRLFYRVAGHRATTLARMPFRGMISYILGRTTRSSQRPLAEYGGAIDRPLVSTRYSAVTQRMRKSGYLALKHYRPSFYPGKIKFVRAEISSEFPDDPMPIWGRLAGELEVDTVPGDHSGIVEVHFACLASVISRYLQEAFQEK